MKKLWTDPGGRAEVWLGDSVDAPRAFAHLPRGVVIMDPPYDAETQKNASAGRSFAEGGSPSRHAPGNAKRKPELTFAALTPTMRRGLARSAVARAARWILTFCNEDLAARWKGSFRAAHARYVLTGRWLKLNGPPGHGRVPARHDEAIVIAHAAGAELRWNGGGFDAIYCHPVVMDRGGAHHEEHLYPAQKPTSLLQELVEDFSDAGETIYDLTMGSCTTGVAALSRGRKFVGADLSLEACELAIARLEAELSHTTIKAVRRKQLGLF